jgi:Flp pilus assembly pilin Flp
MLVPIPNRDKSLSAPVVLKHSCDEKLFSYYLGTTGVKSCRRTEVRNMGHFLLKLWRHDEGQDIAEYAVMLAVILVIVVGTIRLVGSNASNVFSNVASTIQ